MTNTSQSPSTALSSNPAQVKSSTPALGEMPGILLRFFLLTYLLVLANTASSLTHVEMRDAITAVFSITVWLTYSVLYVLPVVVIVLLVYGLWSIPRLSNGNWPAARNRIVLALALVSTAGLQLVLHADRQIYSLYGFHCNGFVWNLIRTPGGIESLGMNETTQWSVATTIGLIMAIQGAVLAVAMLSKKMAAVLSHVTTRRWRIAAAIFVLCAVLFEQAAYGICSLRSYRPVLAAARAFPIYFPITITTLAERMGVDTERRSAVTVPTRSALAYPKHPIQRQPMARMPNFVWLVSESLRADMLDPQIMPNTWALAQKSLWCRQHYSGGNGTRMGVFSMFYGLYGCLWFPIFEEQRPPVIMDVLRSAGYQMEMFTSASFTYPEFDRTMFVNVPPEKLHASSMAIQWQRDEENVGKIISFIEKCDPAKPFMTFMFFESPHAPYHFPASAVIREPFAEQLNYLKLDLGTEIVPVKNRYINACHYLDSQIGRLLDDLKQKGLMDSTIVIVTGDHGEEFREKGRWGHNSTFSEEQTRPPFVLWAPGKGHREVTSMTSHLDIPATVLPLLGVTNPPRDFSLGFDLLAETPRSYTVICDWDRIAYVDDRFKFISAFNSMDAAREQTTTRDDGPISDSSESKAAWGKAIGKILGDLKTLSK